MGSNTSLSQTAFETLRSLQEQAIHDFDLQPTLTEADADLIAFLWASRKMSTGTLGNQSFAEEEEDVLAHIKESLTADLPSKHQNPLDYAIISNVDRTLRENNARISNHGLPDNVLLGSLPIGQANALTLHLPASDEYLILFQEGLFGSLNLLSSILVSIWPEEPGGLPLMPERAVLSQAIEKDARLKADFLAVLEAILITGSSRRIMPRPLSQVRSGSKETLLLYAEMFVLAHEYGHIKRKHFHDRSAITAKCGNRALTISSRSHQDEFGADMHALEWLTLCGIADPIKTYLAYQGSTLFLTCQEILEEALSLLEGTKYSQFARDTHPSGSSRLKSLFECLGHQMGTENANLLANGCSLVSGSLRAIWESVRNDWQTRCQKSGTRAAPAWRAAIESYDRPTTDDDFQEDPPDMTARELGFPGLNELEGLKGPSFLLLLQLGDKDADTRKKAAVLVMEQAHIVMICLVSELSGGAKERKEGLTQYLLSQVPGYQHWIMQLRFTLSRYEGNRDILGAPEVLLDFGVGVDYLRAIAERVVRGEEVDFPRLFVEVAYASHQKTFKKS